MADAFKRYAINMQQLTTPCCSIRPKTHTIQRQSEYGLTPCSAQLAAICAW